MSVCGLEECGVCVGFFQNVSSAPLANIALDCVSTDQSDLTEVIRSNFIHVSHGCKPSRSRAISPVERV